MILDVSVSEHYSRQDLTSRLLRAIGISEDSSPSIDDLGQADEFHLRGSQATLELAKIAGIVASDKVLDIGSGVGGPSRKLAHTRGCQVIGVDLTPDFVEAANALTRMVGLSGRVDFRLANACDLPFESGSFDIVWTQHATMNISDKFTFYREARRVLKKSGRIAFNDIFAGSGELHFPVPWAEDSSISSLATFEETRSYLMTAGFEVTTWHDLTQVGTDWLTNALPMIRANSESPLAVVVGSNLIQKFENLLTNSQEGRVQLAMAVATAV